MTPDSGESSTLSSFPSSHFLNSPFLLNLIPSCFVGSSPEKARATSVLVPGGNFSNLFLSFLFYFSLSLFYILFSLFFILYSILYEFLFFLLTFSALDPFTRELQSVLKEKAQKSSPKSSPKFSPKSSKLFKLFKLFKLCLLKLANLSFTLLLQSPPK